MVAGKKGFCSGHRTEAIEAMKALGDRKTGKGHTPRWTDQQIARRP